jgi:GNAT superfamily N-acetyltransferase
MNATISSAAAHRCSGKEQGSHIRWLWADYPVAAGMAQVDDTAGGTAVKLAIREAVAADAAEIAALRVTTANDLTQRFGKGFWSSAATENGVLQAMRQGKVLIARKAETIVGTLALSARKPWAIDASYFTRVKTPIYLTSMAVEPKLQGQGVGREMLAAAEVTTRDWPGHAIRLDAFDADAGAGAFYEKCGYKEVGRAVFRSVPLIYYERLLTA